MVPRRATSLCLLLLSVWTAGLLAAQQVSAPEPQTGTLIGTVLDANGGVIPGSIVDLDDPVPADHRSVKASDNGFFQFTGLQAGTTYHVRVHATGFAEWSSNDIVLTPGQFFMITDIRLSVSMVEVTVNALTPDQVAAQQLKAEERQRILKIIPNFYVTYERNPAALPARLKFQLAFRALNDPTTIAGFLLGTGIYQMAGYPSYAGGMKGYGQRLGATFAGGYTKILIGDAVLPSLLHQDPRYFYQGRGTTRSRLLHALANPILTYGDNGHREINYSEIGGDLASGAIANAYYPESERGISLVLRSALIGAGGSMANAVLEEFLLRRITSHLNSR